MANVGTAYVTIVPEVRNFGRALGAQATGAGADAGSMAGAAFGDTFTRDSAGRLRKNGHFVKESEALGDLGGLRAGKGFARGLGGSIAGVTRSLGPLAAVMSAAGAVSMFGGFIKDAREAASIARITANVIKQTGGVANVTAGDVDKLAVSIGNKAGIDDEAVQSGANLLLTFKNVRNEVGKGNDIFNQATQAAVDLSAAGFGDLNGASKQLGKALNDPVKGMTALGRSGVTFTEEQKKQIKTLVGNNKLLDAQKIILGEVQSQVGGAAAAATDPMQKLGVIAGNVGEAIGTLVLPVVDRMASFFADKLAPAAADLSGFLAPLTERLKVLFGAGFGGGGGMTVLADTFGKLRAFGESLLPTLTDIGTRIMAVLGPALQQIGGMITGQLLPAFNRFLPAVQPVAKFLLGVLGGAVIGVLKGVINVVQGVLKVITGLFDVFTGLLTGDWSRAWNGLKGILSGAFQAIIGLVQVWWNAGILAIFKRAALFLTKGLWAGMWRGLQAGARGGLELIGHLVQSGFGLLGALFKGGVRLLTAPIRLAWSLIRGLFSGGLAASRGIVSRGLAAVGNFIRAGFNGYVALIRRAWSIIRGLFSGALGAIRGVVSSALGAVKSTFSNALNGAKNIASTAMGRIKSAVSSGVEGVLGFFKDLPGKIAGALGGLGSSLFTTGRNVVQGLIDGLISMGSAITSTLINLLPEPLKKFAGQLGIASPSKVFMGYGAAVSEGFALGISGGTAQVGKATGALAGAATAPRVNLGSYNAGGLAAGGSPHVRVYLGTKEMSELVRYEVDYRDDVLADVLTYQGV